MTAAMDNLGFELIGGVDNPGPLLLRLANQTGWRASLQVLCSTRKVQNQWDFLIFIGSAAGITVPLNHPLNPICWEMRFGDKSMWPAFIDALQDNPDTAEAMQAVLKLAKGDK